MEHDVCDSEIIDNFDPYQHFLRDLGLKYGNFQILVQLHYLTGVSENMIETGNGLTDEAHSSGADELIRRASYYSCRNQHFRAQKLIWPDTFGFATEVYDVGGKELLGTMLCLIRSYDGKNLMWFLRRIKKSRTALWKFCEETEFPCGDLRLEKWPAK